MHEFKVDSIASFTPCPQGSEAFEISFAPLPTEGRPWVAVFKEDLIRYFFKL